MSISDQLSRLKENSFVRNVIILLTGTASAQIVAMLLSPVITRLYGPEAFGLMGTFLAMINIIAPISALTYPIAIVLPRKDIDARAIVKLSLYISLLISILSLILICLFTNEIALIFKLTEIAPFLFCIPLIILFSSSMQIMEQWMIRTKQFTVNAKVTFTQSVIVNGGKVIIGLFYPVAKVLLIFSTIANGLKAFLMYFYSKDKPSITKHKELNGKKLRAVMKEYKEFPYYRAPEVFLNAISTGIPIILLTIFFGPITAGFYSVVRTALSLPSQLIGKAVGDVFYPRITEAYNNNEDVTKLIRKATWYLGVIGVVPFGLIVVFGPGLFSFVYGQGWSTSGEYARWIALWSYVAFMNRPSVMALPVLKAQKFHLIYTVFMLVIRLGALSLGFIIYESDKVAIAFYGISGALLNIGLILITSLISKARTRK